MPTVANLAGPNLAVGDQLFFKTDFTTADIASAPLLGPGNLYSPTYSAIGVFDLRPYRAVYFYFYTGGYGGTTPTIIPRVFAYDQNTPPATFTPVYDVSGKVLPTGGGASLVILTDTIAPQAISAGANIATDTVIAPKPDFCQFMIFGNGAATGVVNPRVSIYGRR